jgi:metallophosphoesterase superfamily enzyme
MEGGILLGHHGDSLMTAPAGKIIQAHTHARTRARRRANHDYRAAAWRKLSVQERLRIVMDRVGPIGAARERNKLAMLLVQEDAARKSYEEE